LAEGQKLRAFVSLRLCVYPLCLLSDFEGQAAQVSWVGVAGAFDHDVIEEKGISGLGTLDEFFYCFIETASFIVVSDRV
jgi:hypothetical protein